MNLHDAMVLAVQLEMDAKALYNADDLAGHLLASLRVEAERPVSDLQQRHINSRLLVALIDMHERLVDIERTNRDPALP